MVNIASAQAASELLVRHWKEGTTLAALPAELRPMSREAGYTVQACVEAISQHPLFGWKIAATKVSERLTREGVGANVLGDPRIALTWLVNELSRLNIPLRAQQIVTTGTCLIPLEIEPLDTVTIDFGVLGSVSCRFTQS